MLSGAARLSFIVFILFSVLEVGAEEFDDAARRAANSTTHAEAVEAAKGLLAISQEYTQEDGDAEILHSVYYELRMLEWRFREDGGVSEQLAEADAIRRSFPDPFAARILATSTIEQLSEVGVDANNQAYTHRLIFNAEDVERRFASALDPWFFSHTPTSDTEPRRYEVPAAAYNQGHLLRAVASGDFGYLQQQSDQVLYIYLGAMSYELERQCPGMGFLSAGDTILAARSGLYQVDVLIDLLKGGGNPFTGLAISFATDDGRADATILADATACRAELDDLAYNVSLFAANPLAGQEKLLTGVQICEAASIPSNYTNRTKGEYCACAGEKWEKLASPVGRMFVAANIKRNASIFFALMRGVVPDCRYR